MTIHRSVVCDFLRIFQFVQSFLWFSSCEDEQQSPRVINDDINVLLSKGYAAFEANDFKTSAKAFRRAVKLYPQSDMLWSQLGRALAQPETPATHKKAADAFKRALRIAPQSHLASYGYGTLLFETRRYHEAAVNLERALAPSETQPVPLDKELPQLLDNLGKAYLRSGREIEARAVFEMQVENGFLISTVRRVAPDNLDDTLPDYPIYEPEMLMRRWPCAQGLADLAAEWSHMLNEFLEMNATLKGKLQQQPEGLHDGLLDNWTLQFIWPTNKGEDHALEAEIPSSDVQCASLAPKTCAKLCTAFVCSTAPKGGNGNGKLKLLDAAFSVLPGPARIFPHCGRGNRMLTLHVTLLAPTDGSVKMSVALNQTVAFTPGSWFVFDDSFEHEVVHPGGAGQPPRVTLMVSFEHPELTCGKERTQEL